MPSQSYAKSLTVGGAAPGTRTASFNTDSFQTDDAERLIVCIGATGASGSTPTAAAKLQFSPDGGTTWLDLDATNAVTPNLTAAGNQFCQAGPGLPVTAAKSANVPIPRLCRVAVTIGGTSPSFTNLSVNVLGC